MLANRADDEDLNSANPRLKAQLSAVLRDQLMSELKSVKSAEDAAVQLGMVTEDLNRRWYEANTGRVISDVQRRIRHPILRWMGATLDGRVQDSEAVFEAKFIFGLAVFFRQKTR
jgi:YqaJ-like viral recombinase domain